VWATYSDSDSCGDSRVPGLDSLVLGAKVTNSANDKTGKTCQTSLANNAKMF